MVVIRLSRRGARHNPKYRVTVADSRQSAKGRFIEIIGHYSPLSEEKTLVIDSEKYTHWVAKGAKPSETVANLYKRMQNPEKRVKPKKPIQTKKAEQAAKPTTESPQTDKVKQATKSTESQQGSKEEKPDDNSQTDKNESPKKETEQ